LGAEVRVGENVNLRAEYTNVRFNGVGTGVWIGPGVDYNIEMLTVGLGFQF
jgi:opacity protein-like surface antigen